MFPGACLPIGLAHPIPTQPPSPLQTLTYIHTLGQPWGPEQMFLCACLPPAPRQTCAHTHMHIAPPTLLLPGWSQMTLGFPATVEAVSHLFFLLHSPDLPNLNTA